MEKENNTATITELVAKAKPETSRFFSSPDKKKGDVQPLQPGTGSPQPPHEPKIVKVQERLRRHNMLVQGSCLGPVFADEYRRIKRPILANAFGKSAAMTDRGNLVLVTSSIPGEGKTYTAINLALSIAHEQDRTALLIDCDVTRSGTSRILGIDDKPGLIEVLEDKASVYDAILRTDIPGFRVIASGRQHDFVTELLSSRKMSDFITEIGKRYDNRIIIFDSPPLLPTPEAQVLTSLVGQVVFVIEAAKTPQALVMEALDMIPEDQATGLVMNKSEGVSGSGYYYGYYNKYREEGR